MTEPHTLWECIPNRYGKRPSHSSTGWSLLLRCGRFYAFLDFGRRRV